MKSLPRESITPDSVDRISTHPKNLFAREDRGIWGIAALICVFVGCKFLRDVMFWSYRSVLRRAGYTYLRRHPRSRHSERMIPSPTGGLCSLPLPVAPATSSGRASLALRSVTSCSLSAVLEFTKVPSPTDSLQVRSTPQYHTIQSADIFLGQFWPRPKLPSILLNVKYSLKPFWFPRCSRYWNRLSFSQARPRNYLHG